MSHGKLMIAALAAVLICAAASAATFVVPDDRDMVHRAHAIVLATALPSYTQLSPEGGVETVTPISIEEWIHGRGANVINVVEPGGTFDDITTAIPGVPRFNEGDRLLLMLDSVGKDRWAVSELVLGKFTFAGDTAGAQVLVRDEDEIIGWDPDLKTHFERRRSAERFLDFVRSEAAGKPADENYWIEKRPLQSSMPSSMPSSTMSRHVQATPMIAPYSATSYTMIVSGSLGSRWTVFPSAVSFYTGTTTEPGAPGGGVTAATTALASWTNDCPSNVNYAYAGVDDGTHTQGLHTPDGRNTILFERDLSSWGISPFSCSSTGYSGTLGIGGVTSASGTHTLNGETFMTTVEVDVEMNRGIANCTLLFSNGDFNSAVTHEVGHTLGFRHSDQARSGSAACSTDSSLECSSSAIMTAFVTTGLNAALQTWDQHAVQALYPGGSCTTCTAPSITQQPSSVTITAGQTATMSVTATGTAPLSYQWFQGTSGSGSPIGGATGSSITVAPTVTTSYWVRVSNSCGTANSSTATVIVNGSVGSQKHVKDDYDGDGKTDISIWRPSIGSWQILQSSTGTGKATTWGLSGDIIVPGDYDGDGKTDIAIWRPSAGSWQIIMSTTGNYFAVTWGLQGDIPVPGDYDGDGKTDQAIWRPSAASWQIIKSTTDTFLGVTFGQPGDIPVPADYDGDGKTDFAVFRPSTGTWVVSHSSNGGTVTIQNGASGDIPVPGDYDGDGKADVAVWRPSNGTWYIIYSSTGVLHTTLWGLSTDIPVPGDYDGDGRTDIAIWRPSVGSWQIIRSSNGSSYATTWGAPGDVPTPRILTNPTGP